MWVLVSDQYLRSTNQDSVFTSLREGRGQVKPLPHSLLPTRTLQTPAQMPYPLREFSGSLSGNASLSPYFPTALCSLIIALIYQSIYSLPQSIYYLPLPERIKDGFQKCIQQDKLNCPRGFITSHRHASVGYQNLGFLCLALLYQAALSVLSAQQGEPMRALIRAGQFELHCKDPVVPWEEFVSLKSDRAGS